MRLKNGRMMESEKIENIFFERKDRKYLICLVSI